MILKEVAFQRRICLLSHDDLISIKFTKLLCVWFWFFLQYWRKFWLWLLYCSRCFFVKFNWLKRIVIDRNNESCIRICRIVECINWFDDKRWIKIAVLAWPFDSVKIFLIILFFIVFSTDMAKDRSFLV